MGKITSLQVQKRNKERVNVFLDDEYAFSLPIMDAAKLRKGQELTDAEIAELRAEDEVARAVNSAVRFLSYRPRSSAEIRRNLAKKSVDEVVIDKAMGRLRDMRLVDDVAFARFWVENRQSFKPLGITALRYELRQKGIPNTIIEEVLAGLDVEESAQDAAYQAASTRLRRYKGLDRVTFRNKIGSFLQRRGFNYGIIEEVLSRLEKEVESDFFEEDGE